MIIRIAIQVLRLLSFYKAIWIVCYPQSITYSIYGEARLYSKRIIFKPR